MSSARSSCYSIIAIIAVLGSSAPIANAQGAAYSDDYTVQGFSQPAKIASVASSISGLVRKRLVREGQVVKAEECIVQIDDRVHAARLELARINAKSEGELEIAEAELLVQRSRLARLQTLAERKHATDVEIIKAAEEVAVARASVQRAREHMSAKRAEFDRLVAESEDYCVRAPFDGVLVKFTKQVSEFVGPGDPSVCIVAMLNQLSVEFMVPRQFRTLLAVDQETQVLFSSSNRKVTGRVDYISPFPNGETGTYTVKVLVDNHDGMLNAGERCLLQGLNQTKKRSRDPNRQLTMRSD